jgi:hypothetical protein
MKMLQSLFASQYIQQILETTIGDFKNKRWI